MGYCFIISVNYFYIFKRIQNQPFMHPRQKFVFLTFPCSPANVVATVRSRLVLNVLNFDLSKFSKVKVEIEISNWS